MQFVSVWYKSDSQRNKILICSWRETLSDGSWFGWWFGEEKFNNDKSTHHIRSWMSSSSSMTIYTRPPTQKEQLGTSWLVKGRGDKRTTKISCWKGRRRRRIIFYPSGANKSCCNAMTFITSYYGSSNYEILFHIVAAASPSPSSTWFWYVSIRDNKALNFLLL